MKKLLVVLLAVLSSVIALATPAQADFDRPTIPWIGDNAYVFQVGDSVTQGCGPEYGQGWRSLGFIGWPGANTDMMRERLTATTEGWPWTTEPSNAEERTWLRAAGALIIGLGTNDVKMMSSARFAENIDWFMGQARGRPVMWFNVQNSYFQTAVDEFNHVLWQKSSQYPNLKVMDWRRWAQLNPTALHDGVHVTTAAAGCVAGRDRLIDHAMPAYVGKEGPRGFWYQNPSTSGPVVLNGWAAGGVDKVTHVSVNVRSDWGHVGRIAATLGTGDLWAQTASGRGFGTTLTENFRGHLICLDLVDSQERWASLGCRTP